MIPSPIIPQLALNIPDWHAFEVGGGIPYTIFHEPWWLDAVCPQQWDEVTVSEAGQVVARLPFAKWSRWGFRALGMPPLTRTLGPQLQLIERSAGARLHREESLVKELVSKLPRHHYFYQICSPGFGNGLSFFMQGYQQKLAYTFRIPLERPLDEVWMGMRSVTRNAIRKAMRSLKVEHLTDVEEFSHFYNGNLQTVHNLRCSAAGNRQRTTLKARIYEAGSARNALCLLGSRDEKGKLLAAIMPIWQHGVMHYFLTTRSPAAANSGAVAMLVWEAIKMAKGMGLIFDFDGFANAEAAAFVASFGGDLVNRTVLSKGGPVVSLVRDLAQSLRRQ